MISTPSVPLVVSLICCLALMDTACARSVSKPSPAYTCQMLGQHIFMHRLAATGVGWGRLLPSGWLPAATACSQASVTRKKSVHTRAGSDQEFDPHG